MLKHNIFLAALLLCGTASFVTAQSYDEDEVVLFHNRCKCVKVTSKFVPSKDNPSVKILERNIEIRIPLNSRMNISDPSSPLRTDFTYNFAELCKKCDPTEVEINGQIFQATQGNCDKVDDTCYTYDRNKCYTRDIPFQIGDKTIYRKAALNPESCHE
ncbi:immunoglobulin J chain [Discoglossus pictus]